ncbi:MAG TPA: 4-hydroxy-tetrahydrodipicolinate reductase [Steroidobacteraceae bacterium]|nr:4-hydroxy-tetrahydrodipicolinate reductase [Steroidobacteraceae bacterium]
MSTVPRTGEAPIRTVLVGATGRMGMNLLREWQRFPQLLLSGAVASSASPQLGADAAAAAGVASTGVAVSARLAPLLSTAQLVIDFSNATAAASNLSACAAARVPLLLGTTGLESSIEPLLMEAARHIPVLVAPNTSLGVNLLLELVRTAARCLPAQFDVEILEAHHRHKRDAPSGTAIELGQAVAAARGAATDAPLLRESAGRRAAPRTAGEIGFAVLRGGDVVGEHEVWFLGEGERLRLGHVATDRAVFARGALQAGVWLVSQPPGRYAMRDFFGFKTIA